MVALLGIIKSCFSYNHASWYVSRVMGFMKEYTNGSVEAVSIKGGSAKGSEAIEKRLRRDPLSLEKALMYGVGTKSR